MEKEFKTIDEQIELLQNRNLHIENENIAREILLNNNISLSSERVQLPYTIPFTNNNIPIIHNARLSMIHHSLDSISLLRRINYQFYFSLLIFTKMIGNSLYTSNLTFTQN